MADAKRLVLVVGVPLAILVGAWAAALLGRKILRAWKLLWSYWALVVLVTLRTALALAPRFPFHEPIGAVVNAFLLFAAAMVVVVFLDTLCFERLLERRRGIRIPVLIRQLLVAGAGFVILVIALEAFLGFDLTPLLATSAVISMVLGLALQDVLKNIFAGLTIAFDRSYEPGDWLKIGEAEGEVLEINWRATKLRTRENTILLIPNATMAGMQLINYSVPTAEHILVLELGTEYGISPVRVREVLARAVRGVSGVHGEPEVVQTGFGPSALQFQVRVTISDRARVNQLRSDLLAALWEACRQEKITIPYPIQTIEMKTLPPVK